MNSPFQDYPDFANDDAEAARRFEVAKRLDPLPEIPPALLNSADINDYVRMTGMLYPFDPNKLKSASYKGVLLGRCIWWDSSGNSREVLLEEGKDQDLTLGPNSITFVQVEPFFRLPDYIALRFNLKITHVHKGILLGTGPLIDPGFIGRLLIPIHNLTPNTYRLGRGEGLIWIEFTKTSPLQTEATDKTHGHQLPRRGKYVPFPERKIGLSPMDYLRMASPSSPVRSSIPEAVLQSQKEAKRARQFAQWLTIGGFVGLIALAIGTWTLIQDTWRVADDVRHQLTQQVVGERDQSSKIEELQEQLQSINKRVTDKISTLQEQVDKVNGDLNRARAKRDSSKKQDEQGVQSK